MNTVRIEVEPSSPTGQPTDNTVDTTNILLWLLNELRHAKTTADVAIAAGCARQDLLDLLSESVDCTGEALD